MKTISNQNYGQFAEKENLKVSDLLLISLNSVIDGQTALQMYDRLQVIKAVKDQQENNELNFEDAAFKTLKDIYSQTKWYFVHQAIVDIQTKLNEQ